MKRSFPIIAIFLLTLLSGCSAGDLLSNKKVVSTDKNWKESSEPYSDSVVCSLKISSTVDFSENNLTGKASIDENPVNLTFVDIDTDNPSMIGNRGDKVSLAKIDRGSLVYLMEETPMGNINIFTLFRDKNIMIMSKQYDLAGPFGTMMIGDCLSGV